MQTQNLSLLQSFYQLQLVGYFITTINMMFFFLFFFLLFYVFCMFVKYFVTPMIVKVLDK